MRNVGRSSVVVLLVAGVMLGACGGSSSSKSGGGGAAPTTAKTPSNGTGSAQSPGGSSPASDDLAALLSKAKTADVKVTYKSDSKSDTFTLVQHGSDSAFISGSSEVVTKGGATYSCSGIDGSTPQCLTTPGGQNVGQAMLSGFFGVYAAVVDGTLSRVASQLTGVSTTTSSDTIAGRAAKCVTVSAALLGESGNITACIDAKTGVFLKGSTDSSAGSGGSIEATSYADSTADDVKLPAGATQMTLPTVPSG